jgi:hypothetical protein
VLHQAEILSNVLDLAEQELRVTARGESVLCLEENAHAWTGDPDAVRPDVVQVFCDCANLGVFSGRPQSAARPSSRIVSREVDIEGRVQSWRVELREVDPGALRVLLNVLRALDLERIELATASPQAPGAAALDPRSLPYPGVAESLPFGVEWETPEKSTAPRTLRIVFAREPDDRLVDEACDALQRWSLLMALGGYAPDDREPFDSGALPDVPFQSDAFTVEQSFEVFVCDEAAFHAVINWARARHGPDFPVEKLVIL